MNRNPVKILFWNLKNNSNEKWVEDIISENDVDIALFAEYKGMSFERALAQLKNYEQHEGYGVCEKITLLCKRSIEIKVKREQNRYALYTCRSEGLSYNLVGIHLPAPPTSDANDRKSVIRNIVHDITEQEKASKNRKTIVIGDFNCNPFDEEVIQKDAFNAVLFKELINKKEVIRYNERDWRRFYNPIMNYISEETNTYGSLYYSSGSAPLYWNSFDQVLVRKELVDSIDALEYLRYIKGKKLIKDVKPNESISDHLPLLVSITKGQ